MDLTGRFPHFLASGHEYLLFGYNYDINSILFGQLQSRQVKTIADRWENINLFDIRIGIPYIPYAILH